MCLEGVVKSLGYNSAYHHVVIIDAGSSGTRVLAYKFGVPFTGSNQRPSSSCCYKSLGYYSAYHHVVIIDAGSSGTRVLAYKFGSEPGLSSYSKNPGQLIKNAEFLTPLEVRESTPVIVRATFDHEFYPPQKIPRLDALIFDALFNCEEIRDGHAGLGVDRGAPTNSVSHELLLRRGDRCWSYHVVYTPNYRRAALKACSDKNKQQPWACFDLVYVMTLLQEHTQSNGKPYTKYLRINHKVLKQYTKY
ncbi:putative adenosine diphosphatase [Operophtera brumata]|uniref:Putative adenosine diphosphatase n=1 Tax=Operophtera brumata TaxID=104452 RepID=A0A0L7KW79_OPEBR|nr:putative adenosine diphosphatase [Operophtera brumata]